MTEAVSFPPLEQCEEALDNAAEWYYRQIHPAYVDEGIVDVQAFAPSSQDDGKISGVRSSKQTAKGAYEDYPNASAGTWGVTLAQVLNAKGRLVDDSKCPVPSHLPSWPKGHSYLDQRINDRSIRKRLRDVLARDATKNGCQYPAPAAQTSSTQDA